MTGIMNIRIQVMANQARKAVQDVERDISKLSVAQGAGAAASGRADSAMRGHMRSLTSFGNQLQWTGRQLQYNWTLPILAAAAAGIHFQMENEKAMTRLKKVYADPGFAHTAAELKALEGAFEALSETYGVAQAEVINIAADWAAAGSSGLALAKQTELTMKTMVLGEMDAAEATQALIAIQAQYNQSSSELADTIARLNNVENQTGTKLSDLVVSMSKAAGVARAAGIDVSHLAAMTAALVPAAGTAAQAGNALKTIISRLLSPTGEAADILKEMGIATDDMAWKGANATSRIELLAGKFFDLSDSQQAVVSATLASRYQINKFEILMGAIAQKGNAAGEGMSYYWKALEAATNRTQYLDQVTRELNAVLDSNPRKWEKIKAVMSNSLANVVQPMLPAIMAIGGQIAMLTKKFSQLDPVTIKWILSIAALLVVLPLAVRYIGSLITLFATFGRALIFLAAPFTFLIGTLGAVFRGFGLVTAASYLLRGAWFALTMAGIGFSIVLPVINAAIIALPSLMAGVVVAIVGGMRTIIAAMGGMTVIMTVWRTVWTNILLFTGVALSQIPRLILVGLGTIASLMAAVLMPVANAILGAMPVIAAALSRGWALVATTFGAIQGVFVASVMTTWVTLGRVLPSAAMAVGVVLTSVWRAIHYGLILITTTFGPMLVTAYRSIGTALFAASWAIHGMMVTAWATMSTAIVTVYRTLGTALFALSWGIYRGIMLIWTALGTAMTTLWASRMALITAITWTWGSVIVPLMMTLGRAIMAALASPWTWAALAVVAILYGLRDQIAVAWRATVNWLAEASDAVVNRVVSAFNMLPQGIANALRAVVKIISDAAKQVYEWFSYLNPFARHSPSLVENVTNGMAVINSQFGTLSQIKGPIDSAYGAIARLKNAMGSMGADIEFAKDRQLIAEINPSALASFDNLARTLVAVRARADQLQAAVKQQEGVVKVWQTRLDAANKELERQRDILKSLEDVADGYRDQISRLNDEISDLASTPITGMTRMEDAIFANEMAQKRLRLEMLKAGEQGGQSIDDIRNKIASMAGEMEMLTGTRENLRSMGAGSEITGVYDKQIDALAKQKSALEKATAPVDKLQTELDELQRQAEILDLEKALQFDPLTRAIDKAANSMQELPFDTIIGRIRNNQAAINQLEPAYNQATEAVKRQEAAIKSAEAAVDSIQASYDAENDKLATMRDLYQEVADAVRDMESALSDASGAANAMKGAKEASEGYVSPALQNFRDAAGGDFADVGGSGLLGREGGMEDQSQMIDDWAATLAQSAGDMFGSFDMFQPLRDMWDKFVAWWNRVIGPWITAGKDFFNNLFDGVDLFGGLEGKGDEVGGFFVSMWDAVKSVFDTVWKFGEIIWGLLGGDVKTTLDTVFGFFVDMWNNLKTIFSDASELAAPLIDALTNLWNIVKVPLSLMFAYIVSGVQVAWSVFNGVLGPVLDWVSGLFMNLWQVVKGVIQMFSGLFTLDFGMFFTGLGNALKGLWGLVWDTLVSLGDVILSALGGLVSGIWDGLLWVGKMIWDGLAEGMKAIGLGWLTDIIGGIIDWVKDLFGIHSPSTVFAEIGGFLMQGLAGGIQGAWTVVKAIFETLFTVIKTILEGVGVVVNWLWTNVFSPTFSLIGNIVSWLWSTVIQPVAGFIMDAIKVMGGVISWLWDNVAQPVFGFIGKAFEALGAVFKFVWEQVIKPNIDFWWSLIKWVWNNVLEPIFGFMGKAFAALGEVFKFVWERVIKPNIDFWWSLIKWVWETVLRPIFALIDDAFRIMGAAIAWVWNNVIKPAWNAIQAAVNFLWDNALKPAFNAIKTGFDAVGAGISWAWNNVLKPAWDAMKGSATAVADWVGEKFTWLKDKVIGIFNTIKDWVALIWGGLLDVFKAPIKIVFDFVNGTMIGPINGLLGKFPGNLHIDDLPHLKEGGRVRGPGTGTSDSILGIDKRGVPTSMVSNGEFVVNAKATRENYSLISAINSGNLPKFDLGGIVGGAWGGIKDAGGWVADKASDAYHWTTDKIGDLVAAGGRFAAEQILKPMINAAKGLIPGDNVASHVMKGTLDKLYNGIVGKGDELDQQNANLSGGTGFGSRPSSPNGSGGLGPMAAAARAFVMSTFGITNIGGYANRNIAGTGTVSDHALGKAIDVMIANYKTGAGIAQGNAVASHFVGNPAQFGTKYVIWRDQINEGSGWKAYGHPGGGRSDTLQHRDHVHVSFFDQGGMASGIGYMPKKTLQPERVLSPRQTIAFERLVSTLDSTGVPGMAGMEAAIFRATTRAVAAHTIGEQTIIQHQGDNNLIVHIHGDLSFPNITDGEDADVFLRNLGDLAGGGRHS